jgi:hypothetical protein
MSLVFCIYLASYLVAGERVVGAAWAAGQHLTPEQWSNHRLLDWLGLSSHHGHLDQGPPRQQSAGPNGAALALQPMVTLQITLPLASSFGADGVLYLLLALIASLTCPATRRLRLCRKALPTGLSPGPHEKPPPIR